MADLGAVWAISNAATLVLVAVAHPRIRAVSPIVLAGLLVDLTGAAVVPGGGVLSCVFTSIGLPLGLSPPDVFVLLLLGGALLFGALAWPALRGLGVLAAALAVVRARRQPPATLLLMLRVFALGRRSERLFDGMSRSWLRVGNVVLIAGPDLARRLVQPHEFLGFLGGRLSRAFVSGTADLEQRIGALDARPDPDGRHRVTEFFCRENTWQVTMRYLAAGSRVVLMDLRTFSPRNRGCEYEIGALLETVPLDRIVLVVDATIDLAFLEAVLMGHRWALPGGVPNTYFPDPSVTVVHLRSGSVTEARRLVRLLFAVAG